MRRGSISDSVCVTSFKVISQLSCGLVALCCLIQPSQTSGETPSFCTLDQKFSISFIFDCLVYVDDVAR